MTLKRPSDPPAGPYLKPEQLDDVARAVMVLGRELWGVIDRMAVLEQVIKDHGIAIETIDTYTPDAAMQAHLETRRKAFVDGLVTALSGFDPA